MTRLDKLLLFSKSIRFYLNLSIHRINTSFFLLFTLFFKVLLKIKYYHYV